MKIRKKNKSKVILIMVNSTKTRFDNITCTVCKIIFT